ncbi:MAG: O-antigen ligase family protein [Egibacteraceae bacterium]
MLDAQRVAVAAAPASGALRGAVAATPALAALALWRPAAEVFAVAEATVVWLGALACLALAALAVVVERRVALPRGRLAAAAGLYVAALALAALSAAHVPALSVAGRAGRHTGAATALAALALAAAAAWAFRDRPAGALRVGVLAAAVPIAGYALVQAAGADPLEWRLVEGGPAVFSTLGNAGFLSAWCGIAAPLAAWGALEQRWAWPWRLLAGGLTVLLLAAAAASGSLQGLVAGGVGLAVLALAWWRGAPRGRGARGLVLAAGGAAVAVAALRGADLAASASASLSSRLTHWQTAWRLAADRPLTGAGLEGFEGLAWRYEAPALAAARGLERSLDSPHNLALAQLTSGGWPLLATWAALLALVGLALAAGWRRLDGERLLALGAVGGAWLAYLTQGAVSLDVAPLAALGAVAAGATLGLGAPEALREVALARRWPAALAAAPVLVVLAVAAVAATLPLRADLAAGRAEEAGQEAASPSSEAQEAAAPSPQGQEAASPSPQTQEAAAARARRLAPYEPSYATADGARRLAAGDAAGALAAYEAAVAADPHALAAQVSLGRIAEASGQQAIAGQAYRAAVTIAPHTPEVLAEAGEHFVREGPRPLGRALLERAADLGH